MREEINRPNQPAFPTRTATGFSMGMTLRDYFAARAMAVILAQSFQMNSKEGARLMVEGMALGAYKAADAMLAEREKGNQ